MRKTFETITELEEALKICKENGGTYRLLCNTPNGQRRAFAWNTKSGILHADYVYKKPVSLKDAVQTYGEEKVYRLFCDSLSTESDSNAIRPKTGRTTKAEVRAETIRELHLKGVIDEATMNMLLNANK